VTVLRLPGHGTIPSGLSRVRWQDFTAAVRLAAGSLNEKAPPDTPFYILGYSNGAALAVEYTLEAMLGEHIYRPDGLFMISPALTVSPMAALAKWNLLLAHFPGLDKLAWLSIEPEYDPYKYNSFSINAGRQIYLLTRHIQAQIKRLDRGDGLVGFPPVLALVSVVDATIPPRGLIDRFMMRLSPGNHRLVLFDVNRGAADMALLKDNSRPVIDEMMTRELPFTVALLTNRGERDRRVEIREKRDGQIAIRHISTPLSWPVGVYSLSHVALPFSPEDPVYGMQTGNSFSLGRLEPRGEKDVLLISASSLLRLRSNPFYDIVEQEIRRRIINE
jgi:alpha-beta hydrolase superfamily lysophospholipase